LEREAETRAKETKVAKKREKKRTRGWAEGPGNEYNQNGLVEEER